MFFFIIHLADSATGINPVLWIHTKLISDYSDIFYKIFCPTMCIITFDSTYILSPSAWFFSGPLTDSPAYHCVKLT